MEGKYVSRENAERAEEVEGMTILVVLGLINTSISMKALLLLLSREYKREEETIIYIANRSFVISNEDATSFL